ncbi:Uncharacterized protein Rs2_21493 [Raphanus sativus]|nr:Uncharacterized protein Rs2_21493 [Raphanus sativus]
MRLGFLILVYVLRLSRITLITDWVELIAPELELVASWISASGFGSRTGMGRDLEGTSRKMERLELRMEIHKRVLAAAIVSSSSSSSSYHSSSLVAISQHDSFSDRLPPATVSHSGFINYSFLFYRRVGL